MSELDDILTHYGVKGMKWGVRNDRGHEGERAKAKTIAKADKKFEKQVTSPKTFVQAYNHMAGRMNDTEIDRINNDPKFRGRSMLDMDDPVTKAYYNEYSSTATKILNDYASSNIGTNASGTKKVQFDYDVMRDGFPRMMIVDVDVKQASLEGHELDVQWDDDGKIVAIYIYEPLMQTALSGQEFLTHYGVKGMKWGVRNDKRRSAKESSDFKKTKPLRRQPAQSLSTRQLKEVNERLQLEANYNRLHQKPSTLKTGTTKAQEILAAVGIGVTVYNLAQSNAGKAAVRAGRRFIRRGR